MLQPHRARAQGQGGPEVVKRPPARRWSPGLGAGDCRAGRSCAWATVLGEARWPAWAWGSRWTEPLPGGLSASPSHTEQWGHWPQRGSGPRGALGMGGQALALHQAWRTAGAVECQRGPGVSPGGRRMGSPAAFADGGDTGGLGRRQRGSRGTAYCWSPSPGPAGRHLHTVGYGRAAVTRFPRDTGAFSRAAPDTHLTSVGGQGRSLGARRRRGTPESHRAEPRALVSGAPVCSCWLWQDPCL